MPLPRVFWRYIPIDIRWKTDGVMAGNMGMREIERNPSRLVHPTVRWNHSTADRLHARRFQTSLIILYNIPIPTPISVDLLNYCLDHMLSPQESIGVQALSIRIAYLLCRKEPELLQELQLILENTELDFYSTGVRTTVRNTLKKIRATKGRE